MNEMQQAKQAMNEAARATLDRHPDAVRMAEEALEALRKAQQNGDQHHE